MKLQRYDTEMQEWYTSAWSAETWEGQVITTRTPIRILDENGHAVREFHPNPGGRYVMVGIPF